MLDRHRFFSLGVDSPYVLVVDFGLFSMKMVLFEKGKGRWRLLDLHRFPSMEFNDPEALSRSLKDFLSRHPRVKKPDLIATWRHDVTEKPIILPVMPARELSTAIRFAAERNYAIPVNECFMDYMLTRDFTTDEGTRSGQYFLYALPKTSAAVCLNVLATLSDQLLAVVPSSVAQGIILDRMGGEGKGDIASLDVGYENSSVHVFRASRPLLSRLIPIGGRDFTEALVGEGETGYPDKVITREEAETMKEKMTLMPDETSPADRAASWGSIAGIRSHVEKLQEELLTSVRYYQQQGFGGTLVRIFLCGDGSRIQGLERYLEAGVGIPVARPQWRRPDDMEIDKSLEERLKGDLVSYLPSLGALYAGTGRWPNLAPRLFAIQRRRRLLTKVFRMFLLSLVMTAVLANAYIFVKLGLVGHEWRVLGDYVQNASEFQAVYNKIESARKMRQEVSKGEIPLLGLFKELSLILPGNALLEGFSFNRAERSVGLKGRISGGPDPVETCAEFVGVLNHSPYFIKAELSRGQVDGPTGDYLFDIAGSTHEFR